MSVIWTSVIASLLFLTLTAEAQTPSSATAPFYVNGPNGAIVGIIMGAAEGMEHPSLVGNYGDLRGWRNLQGGAPNNPHLDIGAGSTETPGNVTINYDIGRDFRIYDGRKRLIARFGRNGIVFYRKPRIVTPRR